MLILISKAIAVWFLILVLAVINGALREKFFVPALGQFWAQIVSGITLSLIILAVTLALYPFLRIPSAQQAWLVGGLWLTMTEVFEFGFGRFVQGYSWRKMLEAYNISTGNLWVVVLIFILVSPWVAGLVRGR